MKKRRRQYRSLYEFNTVPGERIRLLQTPDGRLLIVRRNTDHLPLLVNSQTGTVNAI